MENTKENEGSGVEGVKEHLCFEDGVVEAVDRVQLLLTDKDIVVVGIDGSDADVGKTTLLTQLSRRLDALRVPVTSCSDISGIPDVFSQIDTKKTLYGSNKCVVIIEHAGMASYVDQRVEAMVKLNRNTVLTKTFNGIGIGKTEVDLYVSIYAKGKPFARSNNPLLKPLGDVIICNEKATDKPRTNLY